MKRKSILSIASTLLLLALILGIFTCIKYPQFQEVVSMEVLDINKESMTTQIKAAIFNPNIIGGTLISSESEIYINDIHLGKGITDATTKLKGKDTTHMQIKVDMKIEMLSRLLRELGQKKRLAKVKVVGDYQVRTGIKDITLSVESVDEIDVWAQLEEAINKEISEDGFRIVNIRPKNVSFGKTEVDIEMEIRNSFPFAFELQHVDLKLYADKQFFGTYTLEEESKQLAPNARKRIQGSISVRNTSIFSSIGSLIFGDLVLRGEGIAEVEIMGYIFKIPIKQQIGSR